MNRIAQMTSAERAEVFAETAERKLVADAIVEKDFWTCWMLQQLFSVDAFAGKLLFKGGTSLSKVFHAINRFSEDIDLAVDYVALGFTGECDPRREGISKTRRTSLLGDMMAACQAYISEEFIGILRTRCQEVLGKQGAWSLDVNQQDPNTVLFSYPPGSSKSLDYVVPQIVLEMGTHAEFVPRDNFKIRSFVEEEFPNLISDGDISVVTLLAKRTFWEKATILHAEFYRPAEKALRAKYSRHYYDLAMLAESPIRDEALADIGLLDQVVLHKQIFYPSAWARYELAVPGSLRLRPADDRRAELERDYRDMDVMIFGKPPSFDSIVNALVVLEQEINRQDTGYTTG
ncbi:MAG: nucleotidyl transferase AbiEii/AbiGii toxin family protein [Acidobacteriaceae bacterium]|nr:nucleotidyl transferase AbiEii/AbiGii toxin family protein [Acidobacteriaceae bacterium]